MMAYKREHNDGSEGTPMHTFSAIPSAALAVGDIFSRGRGKHESLLPLQKPLLASEPVFANLLIEGMKDTPS
jgi:hypothetical protein